MEVSGELHVTAALPPGKEPRYLLDRRVCGPQSCSGCGGEEKNSQPTPGIEYVTVCMKISLGFKFKCLNVNIMYILL